MAPRIDSLQFALFSNSAVHGMAHDFWTAATDAPLIAFQQTGPGMSVANGQVEGCEATVALQGNRIDLFFAGSPRNDASVNITGAGPQIENWKRVSEVGKQIISKLALKISFVQRVAFILQASEVATDQDAAAELVKINVPGLPDPGNSTDLFYQINRPFSSRVVPGSNINRFCRWFSGGKQIVVSTNNATLQSFIFQKISVSAVYLDLSTEDLPNGSPPVPLDRVSDLFEEFIGEAEQLLSRGYARLTDVV